MSDITSKDVLVSHLATARLRGDLWVLHQVHLGEEGPVMSYFIVRGVPFRMLDELFNTSFFEEVDAAAPKFPLALSKPEERLFDMERWHEQFHDLLDHVYANMDMALEPMDPDEVPEGVVAILDDRISGPSEGTTTVSRPMKH